MDMGEQLEEVKLISDAMKDVKINTIGITKSFPLMDEAK